MQSASRAVEDAAKNHAKPRVSLDAAVFSDPIARRQLLSSDLALAWRGCSDADQNSAARPCGQIAAPTLQVTRVRLDLTPPSTRHRQSAEGDFHLSGGLVAV